MNKIHFLAFAALGSVIFASCSNEELVSSAEKPSVAIDFKAMANKTTRATEVTTSSIDRFRVFGCSMDAGTSANHVQSFNNVTVTKDAASGKWSYTDVQYWAPEKDYFFIAVSTNNATPAWTFTAPATHDASVTTDDFKGFGSIFMDIDDVNADRDLVYAYATRTTDATITDASAVSFSFNHMLSRIGFKFTNGFSNASYTLQISNVKVAGLTASASCQLGIEPSSLAWVPTNGVDATEVSVTVPDNNNVTTTAPVSSADYKYIIPGSQELVISFDVMVKLNGQEYSKRSLSGSIAAKEYKPGKSYMLTATIDQNNIIEGGAKPIEFTVQTVAGWGNDEDGDVSFE